MSLKIQPFLAPIKHLLDLFYPRLCVACGQNRPSGDACFCLPCRLKLRPTDHHLHAENEFTQRFWGTTPVQAGAALFYFQKKSPVQRALHQLKYKNQPEIGLQLGREMGRRLAQSELFQQVDVIVPVPLHPKKARARGYNQSEKFAEGIAEIWGKRLETQALVRQIFSKSQTTMHRSERFANTESAFQVKLPKRLAGKNILLVDDVLTTGATLENCGKLILEIPGTRLFLATIALAVRE